MLALYSDIHCSNRASTAALSSLVVGSAGVARPDTLPMVLKFLAAFCTAFSAAATSWYARSPLTTSGTRRLSLPNAEHSSHNSSNFGLTTLLTSLGKSALESTTMVKEKEAGLFGIDFGKLFCAFRRLLWPASLSGSAPPCPDIPTLVP